MSQFKIQNPKSKIALIVAVSENGVIGRDNQLPWHLPADLKRFKQLTTGHAVIMGRKTFESIGKPLPLRRNIVITRRKNWNADGIEVAHSLDEAIGLAASDDEVFILGGAEVFRDALPRANTLYLTRVHATVDGDVYFPPVDWSQWQLIEEERHDPSGGMSSELPFNFLTYRKLLYRRAVILDQVDSPRACVIMHAHGG